MIKKIIILDFTDGKVLISDIDESIWEDTEDFITDKGLDVNNCQYMVINKISLIIE